MSQGSELWKRKFEPITDWKPAPQTFGNSGGSESPADEGFGEARKAMESLNLQKRLEAFSDEAKGKIKEMASVLDELAGKSSNEARSFLAKTIESVAEKIKPI
ncbi:MAG: hypothetical protein V1792_11735 [Pseudomonadota bacterium]